MTGKINLSQLRRLAEQGYTRAQPHAQPTTTTAPPKVASADEALLQKAKSMPPRQFLTAAKQAKNVRMYPEEIVQLSELVPKVMDSAVHLDVPLKVESHYGPTWFDAK